MVQVNNLPYVTLRIRFKKLGRLQYISHLDLVRTMSKILVRAKLPMWYTEGFNPKPKMIFAAPLSIGAESMCEFMDVRLVKKLPPSEVIEILNKNMTEEMQVLEAYYPEGKFTDLKWLSYTIVIMSDAITSEVATACDTALAADEMKISKKTKSGETIVDIRPMIKSVSAVYDSGKIRLSCTLSADSQSFLNPEYVVKYLKETVGILSSGNLLSESYEIMRESAFFENMEYFS